ncbi:MAG: hypothetical protein M3Z57_09035, partial [Candidatus Dormibacteraeota bacterium]|nr:hypothetical protein [Candidatus Dormibacteraeota bacterium]
SGSTAGTAVGGSSGAAASFTSGDAVTGSTGDSVAASSSVGGNSGSAVADPCAVGLVSTGTMRLTFAVSCTQPGVAPVVAAPVPVGAVAQPHGPAGTGVLAAGAPATPETGTGLLTEVMLALLLVIGGTSVTLAAARRREEVGASTNGALTSELRDRP